MPIKDLDAVAVQVVRSALEFMLKAMERRVVAAVSDNHRDALKKDVEALKVVISKL